jgi:hypothetical protein
MIIQSSQGSRHQTPVWRVVRPVDNARLHLVSDACKCNLPVRLGGSSDGILRRGWKRAWDTYLVESVDDFDWFVQISVTITQSRDPLAEASLTPSSSQ